jgi:hypothetical protein
MGMSIDDCILALTKERKTALHENKQAFDIAIDVMRKYQQLQAEYENRLKADMVAMLTELQLEIGEIIKEAKLIDKEWANILHYSEKVIQQKINKLKENTDGTV